MKPHIKISPWYQDERGSLRKIWRNDWGKNVKEVYCTSTHPGVVKGFHFHYKQTDHIACIKGMIKVIVIDEYIKEEPMIFYLGEKLGETLVIPPKYWHGWKCVSPEEAWIINACSAMHDKEFPDEVRVDPHEFLECYKLPDLWKVTDR